ncbi:unnamed protein product [Miscanthus lutarioriparius]|uniref:Retroviral polymerase SH3-like domain-containing protein n=1 Tax=Miscanthus lutarioriparius TaxID=422564 RepID=A0A811Q5C1_9POAL|nr:unnamed protein product [Miscanthus lutarioriparius]
MSLTVADGGRGSGDGRHRQVFPTLTTTNYTSWSIRVQAIMEEQGWWDVVEPPEGNSAVGAMTEALAGKDKKVRAHFFQCLSDELLMQVAKKKTGKEVWDSLKARFVGAERVKDARLQTLKAEFDALKMKEEETVDEFTGKLTAMSVKYGNLGGTLEDAAMVKKLFDTVPDKFIHVIAGIEQFYNLQTLVFDEAVGRLKAFEERTTRRGVGGSRSADGQVLLTQAEWEARQKKSGGGESSGGGKSQGGGGRGRGCGRGGSRGGRGGRVELGPFEPASNTSLHTEMILEEKKVMPELFFVGEGEKLDDRSVSMVYFGIKEGSKAHRMYNPKTNKIVVSRDVVFEESLKWSWESADNFSFAENRDEKDGQFYSGDYGSLDSGVGDAQGAQGVNETGGATSGGEQSTGGMNAEMGYYDVQTEQNPTIGSEPATPQSSPHLSVTGHDSMDVDDTIDTDSGPIRFRSLNEVYDDSYEVELMDENVEALLVEMEEPTCFRDAADRVLVGYTDSDHGADQVERTSTGGMAFYLGEILVSWCSQKQKTVALSSCEAEFMAATSAARQALWLRNLLSEITEERPSARTLYVDNNSARAR